MGRAEVGDQDDARTAVEGQHGRRAPTGGGAPAGLIDQLVREQRFDALRDRRASQSGAPGEVRARHRLAVSNQAEHAPRSRGRRGVRTLSGGEHERKLTRLLGLKSTEVVSCNTCDCPVRHGLIHAGLLLDTRIKRDYVGPHVTTCSCCHRRDRVHRCRPRAVRPARRRTPRRGRRVHRRRAPPRGGARSVPSARSPAPRSWSRRRTWTSSTSARPTICTSPLAEAALAAGKHVICEKPIALDGDGAQALADAAAAAGRIAVRPVRLPLLPHRARGARARAHGSDRARCACSTAAICRTGCCVRRMTTGASTSTSAAPRAPSRTSARTGATSPSSSPATASRGCRARTMTALPRAPRRARRTPPSRSVDGHGTPRAVTTEDAAIVQFETDERRGRLDGHQPDLRRSQEPPLARARRRRGGARLQPGGAGVAVGRPARDGDADQARPGAPVGRRGALRDAPARPPAGLRRLLRRLRRRDLRRDRDRRARRRAAGVRRRPARRAAHRRGADAPRARSAGSSSRPGGSSRA